MHRTCYRRGTHGKGGGLGTTRESSTEDRKPAVNLKEGVGITQVKWGPHIPGSCVWTTKSIVTSGHSGGSVPCAWRCEQGALGKQRVQRWAPSVFFHLSDFCHFYFDKIADSQKGGQNITKYSYFHFVLQIFPPLPLPSQSPCNFVFGPLENKLLTCCPFSTSHS